MSESSISRLRDLAIGVVEARTDHHLPLGMRQAIWSALGPRATRNTDLSIPHRRRIALALASAEHVRPIWQRRFSNAPLWNDVVATIGGRVRGDLDMQAARERYDRYWDEVIHLADTDPLPPVAAGFAIVQVLSCVISDEQFDPTKIELRREDEDDPTDFDTAVWAETAEAGGFPLAENADADRRRSFWLWWLAEAASPTLDGSTLLEL